MSSSFRKDRLASAIVRETSRLLLTEMRDPRLGFITVTRAKVSDDYQHAVIYVTVLGDKKRKKLTLAGLKSAQGFVQRELTRRIQMRSFPVIRFEIDAAIEKMYEIQKVLDGVKKERKAAPAPEEGAKGEEE
jgi:ribosome-binding factor A